MMLRANEFLQANKQYRAFSCEMVERKIHLVADLYSDFMYTYIQNASAVRVKGLRFVCK